MAVKLNLEKTKHYASLQIENKILLLNNWRFDHILVLYGQAVKPHNTFISFIKSGLKNNELCLFAYDGITNEFHVEAVFGSEIEVGRLCPFRMGEINLFHDIKYMNAKLHELENRIPNDYPGLRVLIDFGNLTTLYAIENIIDIINRLHNMSFPIRSMIAFNANSLHSNIMNTLLELYENVMISTQNEHATLMLNFRSTEMPNPPLIESISRSALQEFVKKHLEMVVLSIILENALCGYDLIRRIYQKYHTFLSQGTVYPLLYDLLRHNLLIIVKSGNSRSKVYALTTQGEQIARDRINDFFMAERYMLESFGRA